MGLYILQDADSKGAVEFSCKESNDPLKILLGEEPFPTVFQSSGGRKTFDLLCTNLFSIFLVSERFIEKTMSIAAKGIVYKPVILEGYTGGLEYFGLVINGRSGPFDNSVAVEREEEIYPGRVVMRKKGITIDLATWDKSDFFVPAFSSACVVTERVVDALNGLTNIYFKRLEDVLV